MRAVRLGAGRPVRAGGVRRAKAGLPSTPSTDPDPIVDPPPTDPGGGGSGNPYTAVDLLFNQGLFLTKPLPSNATLQAQAATDAAVSIITTWTNKTSPAPWINMESYGANVYIAPIDTPLVPVLPTAGSKMAQSYAANLRTTMAAGIPIPAGAVPAPGTDGTLVIAQPDWTLTKNGHVYSGRLYELWIAVNNGDGTWSASWGGRMTDTKGRTVPHARAWSWGDATNGWGANGLAEEDAWMSTATKIPLSHTTIRTEEMARGEIRHPIGFMLPSVAAASRTASVWPASSQKFDGSSQIGLPQGSRLRFLPTEVEDPTWPLSTKVLFRAIRDYGIVFNDTAGNFAIRAEPGCVSYFNGQNGNPTRTQALKSLPWGNLKLLAVGSDSNQAPVIA